eukprot:augustus_masked-scaffold_45-processed-gene-1.127-mRNA-1 protein AED:0.47 eAED:0.47 QI:0/-1/0/1/-1/1/1/0/921
MAHLLITKGLSPNNITILEKDNRYGGKTVSKLDKSEVQLNNPKYSSAGNLLKGDKTKKELYENGKPVFHELGTCYLSPGYYALRQLLKDLQKATPDKSIDITKEVGPDTYAIEGGKIPKGKQLSMEDWVYESAKDTTFLDDLFGFTPGLARKAVDLSVFNAKRKYCILHKEMMGSYYYTIPARPQQKMNEKLKKPFGDFLRDNKLESLIELFTYATTAQGYGLIDEVPTYWGMCWMTPDLLDGYFEWHLFFSPIKDKQGSIGCLTQKLYEYFENKMNETGRSLDEFNNPRKGMLVAGWLAVWDKIVNLHGLGTRIKLNTDIENITRKVTGGKAAVTVKYIHAGKKVTEDFDFLIMAAPISDAYQDSTVQTFPLELTKEESSILLSDQIVASTFRTNLFKPPQNGKYADNHLRIFTDAILKSDDLNCSVKPGDGDVFGVRDSYKAIQPGLSSKNGNKTDPLKDTPREKMCYQYIAPSKKYNEKKLKQLLDDKQKLFFNKQTTDMGTYDQQEHLETKAWTYFTHFEGDDMDKGSLWNLIDLQGKNNTFFVHASNNFESVLDIVNYNNMILDGLTGQLDSFLKPETDYRPEEYQRPSAFLVIVQNIQVFEWIVKVFEWIVKVFEWSIKGLDLFLAILYWVFCIFSHPFAELTWLRNQRYKLQVDFKVADLGHPQEYNLKKFIAVSPTTRGYVDFVKGKSNGMPPAPLPKDYDPSKYPKDVGPGDQIFKIVQAPKNKFKEHFPNIPSYPEVQCTIQWNLQDFRTATSFWLETLNGDFLNYLWPISQNILATVNSIYPQLYSWLFSWAFAIQFRCLVGYSYRFEDAKGGGLYIPECDMLKKAVEEYGEEAGKRICLTVCKVFTEEVMKKKKQYIELKPDFVDYKPGYGCEVRTIGAKEHAFSNHTLYEFRTLDEKKEYDKFSKLSW